MEEKQIAEIDARIAPIFRAVDAYVGFIATNGNNHSFAYRKELTEQTYCLIHDFAEVFLVDLVQENFSGVGTEKCDEQKAWHKPIGFPQ